MAMKNLSDVVNHVTVHLLSDTVPIELHDVLNSYEKDSMYNVWVKGKNIQPAHRYVPENIWCIVETRAWHPQDIRFREETPNSTNVEIYLKTTRQPVKHENIINSFPTENFYCFVKAGDPKTKTDKYYLYPKSNIREIIDYF